jgi:hypothetical protein
MVTISRQAGVGGDERQAWQAVLRSDDERTAFHRYLFNANGNAPELCDLVVNTHRVSLRTAAALIRDLANAKEMKGRRRDARRAIERLFLKQKAIVTVLYERKLPIRDLELELGDGTVTPRGTARDHPSIERCRDTVAGVLVADTIRNEISFDPRYVELLGGIHQGMTGWRPAAEPPDGGRRVDRPTSLAVDPDLLLALHVHGEVVEVRHELLEILGREPGQVQVHAFLLQRAVHLRLRFARQEGGQLHARADELHRDPDVDPVALRALFRLDLDAQVLPRTGVRARGCHGRQELLGLLDPDFALAEHFQDLAGFFTHFVPPQLNERYNLRVRWLAISTRRPDRENTVAQNTG